MANPANSTGGSDPAADKAAKSDNALWYTVQGIGRAYLVKIGSSAAGDADIAGLHGYSTIEQAQANPNTKNAAVQATLTQWNAWASLPVGGGEAGVMQTVNITAPGTSGNTSKKSKYSTPQNPTAAAADNAGVTGFLHGLTSANLWIRVAKVIAGGVILTVGLVKLTGLESRAPAIIGKAVKAAPLL